MSKPLMGVMTARLAKEQKERSSLGPTWDSLGTYGIREGMQVIVFHPKEINWKKGRLFGWKRTVTESGEQVWKWSSERFPNVIYDGAFLYDVIKQPEYMKARRKLRAAGIPLFNPPLPNKYSLYRLLRKTEANKFIPQTVRIRSLTMCMDFLQENDWVFLKPVRGSGGRGIIEVQKAAEGIYKVCYEPDKHKRIHDQLNKQQLRKLLQGVLRKKTYLGQIGVSLISYNEQKIDFRVPLYRDRQGEWQSTGVICKLGKKGMPVTNFHSGGTIIPFSQVLEYHQKAGFTLPSTERMIECAKAGARAISKSIPCIGILGIDIGIDTNGNPWMLDFNPRPGRDIMKRREIDQAMMYTAQFMHFLIRSNVRCSNGKSKHK